MAPSLLLFLSKCWCLKNPNYQELIFYKNRNQLSCSRHDDSKCSQPLSHDESIFFYGVRQFHLLFVLESLLPHPQVFFFLLQFRRRGFLHCKIRSSLFWAPCFRMFSSIAPNLGSWTSSCIKIRFCIICAWSVLFLDWVKAKPVVSWAP